MATVLVWENNMLPGGRSAVNTRTGQTVHWPGHASLLIDDVWHNRYDDSSATYVSWWPGLRTTEANTGRTDRALFSMESRVAGMRVAFGSPKTNFVGDMMGEKYLPDHIIRIAVTPAKQQLMMSKWASIRTKDGAHYRALYKNCSTIVARIMREGGLSTGLNNFWRAHSLVWTPNKIKEYALGAGGKSMTWAALYAEMSQCGVKYSDWGGQTRARDRRYCSSGAECVR
jgi:hypothetical protein